MNWDQIKGNWKEFKGKIRQRWGRLTDDEIEEIDGRRAELVGTIQKKYGYAKEQAEKDVEDFCGCC
jgi:uncharacterized protein YjbJ (UPF0337 family)